MSALTERLAAALPGHLRLNQYDSGVINMTTADGREMVREDVDAFRSALTGAGYAEVKSWVATQGMSWLHPGLFAGVSFEVRPGTDTTVRPCGLKHPPTRHCT